jgi:hypothetical protein
MKSAKSARKSWIQGTASLLLLGVVLMLLFWKSFSAGYVHFANDGPLGQQMAADNQLPQDLTGSWLDLNSIGSRGLAYPPCLSALIRWVLGPVGVSKFLQAIVLFLLGSGALYFFRKLKLSWTAAICGALAAMLNSTFFSAACWGVGTQEIALGWSLVALGLVTSIRPEMKWPERGARLALAGMAIGQNIFETSDIGAIFSVFIAFYVVYRSLASSDGSPVVSAVRGARWVAVIALCAGFMAFSNLQDILKTQISGVVGMQQDEATKAVRWREATQWSFPKAETLGLIVPGLFGYRMDTPEGMEMFSDWFEGGNYWGTVGSDPLWDQYFKNGRKGPAPPAVLRFSGGGNYAGVVVTLVALWAALQSFRKQRSAFEPLERRLLWFWSAAALVSLLLAYGRFAPFYKVLYALPGSSYMRNPAKFLGIFSLAIVVLFAYGVHGIFRRYVSTPAAKGSSWKDQLKTWWSRADAFDRAWTVGCLLALGAGLAAWVIYGSQRAGLEKYLADVQLGPEAKDIASFSIRTVGWFDLYLAVSVGVLTLILTGVLAGRRAAFAGMVLAGLLLADLGRADLPWMIYWNYHEKYETSGPNPVVRLFLNKPYEHRVVLFPERLLPALQLAGEAANAVARLNGLYDIEWNQHLFPYYNIQTLDIIQRPRTPEDIAAYEAAFTVWSPESLVNIGRRWELTNTRYILGLAGFLDMLNVQFDPAHERFRVLDRFDVTLKPGITQPTRWEDFTAELSTNGDLAVFDFTGALPRARLYATWRLAWADPAALQQWLTQLKPFLPRESFGALASQPTNDLATLKELTSRSFDPWQTVLLSHPIPTAPGPVQPAADAGAVEFTSYAPKHVELQAKANSPCVLLLNDKYDPNWQVWVDGKREELLRCNFIMRGVFLPAGSHRVDFYFRPDQRALYVSLAAIVVAALLAGYVWAPSRGRSSSSESSAAVSPGKPASASSRRGNAR